LWAIRSEENVGFGKVLRENFPTDQIDLLQILSNGGVPTKVVIRDLDNNIINIIQILWDKTINQAELRQGLQILLGKLEIITDIELAVISIHREKSDSYDTTTEAVDILEANQHLFGDKLLKWQMIKKWNDNPAVNDWIKFDIIDPKCQKLTTKNGPYNIIQEFEDNDRSIKTIEILLWHQQDVDEHIGTLKFERRKIDLKIYRGKI
jgi:hypothetical protein